MTRWLCSWMILLLALATGCGAAAPKAADAQTGGAMAEAPGAPNRDADGIMDESDVAEEGMLYRAEPPAADPSPVSRTTVAQAPTPGAGPPPAGGQPGPMPAKPDAGKPEVPEQAPTIDTGTDKKLAGPLLIYKANVHLAVFEAKKAIDEAEKISKDLGGYLVRRDDTSITVRVPAGSFDGALTRMLKLGDVLHRDVSVQDVTAEYFDLQIRLKNAEAVRDRLQDLLKKATNVSDAIQVERELARVTADIESMKGRLKLLRELVTFSTITLRFEGRPVDRIDSKVTLPFPWLHQLGLSNLLRL